MKHSRLIAVLLCLSIMTFSPALAQEQCGEVDAVSFPVDPATYQIVQDYGVPSYRHQGRYHTGEDWFGGRETSLGSPVMAVANGRVTFSAPSGWGRDGGVVIIEHTFPNGDVAYSMYGHMMEQGDIRFPPRLSCVVRGQVIGAVGDSRPAPHLHLEIRVNNPDIPGAGYEWESPDDLGYRRPSQFLINWMVWLSDPHRWHVELPDTTLALVPPLPLEDNSLLVYDGAFLRRVLPDGRILWRVTLEQPLVGLIGYQRAPLLFFADGTVQRADNMDGTLGDRWSLGTRLNAPALWQGGDELYFSTPDDQLIALSENRREVVWRLDGIPPFVRGSANPFTVGVVSADHELFTVSSGGDLLDRAQLRVLPALSDFEGGRLLVYSRNGLWMIADGTWSSVVNSAGGMDALALAWDQTTGVIYTFDGRILSAYDAGRARLWLSDAGQTSGAAALALYEGVLVLVSGAGDIVAARASDGAICGRLKLWGASDASVWQALGGDEILRLIVGEQILGLDWAEFTRFCGEG